MAFDVVRGRITNLVAVQELIPIMQDISSPLDTATLYLGYPLSANADSTVTVDALYVSSKVGIVAFIFTKLHDREEIIEEQGALYFQLTNTLTQYPSLRKGRFLAVNPTVITIVPTARLCTNEAGYILSTFENLHTIINELPDFDSSFYPVLVESLQRIASIKPRKKRDNVQKHGSKGDIIKKIEKEIANLDQWQKKAALEIVSGPQRIRGLAGSGKTIVLALKAAYLHSQYPDWDIAVTYYTRSLWQQYRDLITKFVFEFSRDEPNWDKLHLYHAWGSQSERGIYAEIAHSIGQIPTNFTNARLKYGRDRAFSGICNELDMMLPENYRPMYDLLLIDEAQDMPASFFRLVYKSVKDPKRIVWAYDELQNLSAAAMPTIKDMFGVDENGRSIVELKNEINEPMQDIILPVCYRNPPWILALAHSLGFGIYRKELVQHFDALTLWEDIGYKVESGSLEFGKQVKLARRQDATPSYFKDLLDPKDVIKTFDFDNVDEQYNFIAQEIRKNITEDELDPDDILVIFPSVISAKSQYQRFAQHLARYSISSMLAGVTNDRDYFRIPGSISCATIYRAKGNEAPMVYVLNADSCYEGLELIKLRNTIFTALTRSRAWVRIAGVGSEMEGLIQEINKFIEKGYVLDFTIPTKKEMEHLRTINRERSTSDSKKIEEAQKGVRTLLEMVHKGEIDASQIPELNSLVTLILNRNFDNDSDNE